MGNDGHVTDVCRLVHESTDLLDREAIEGHLSAGASSLDLRTRDVSAIEIVYACRIQREQRLWRDLLDHLG